MKHFVIIALAILAMNKVHAQGCSDAGFCSLGALKEVNVLDDGQYRLDLGTNAGIGEERTLTINPYVQYYSTINKHLSLMGKVTATYADGFLGSSFQVGDFYGLATYALKEGKKNEIRLLAGIKVPFTHSNTRAKDGGALPLDYQSSLGTYDAILGANYVFKSRLELNAGLQAPVIQVNKNTFFPDDFSDPRTKTFAPTNQFRRKADVLLRAGYYLRLGRAVMLKPNLLGIYHLGEDTYEDHVGVRTSITGSKGFTLNGALSVVWKFKNNTRFELIAATPFIARKVRADGLTRSAAFNLQYSILLKSKN